MFLDAKSQTLRDNFSFVFLAGGFFVIFYILQRRIKTSKLERRLRLLERKHENEWIILEPAHFLSKLKTMQNFSSERCET